MRVALATQFPEQLRFVVAALGPALPEVWLVGCQQVSRPVRAFALGGSIQAERAVHRTPADFDCLGNLRDRRTGSMEAHNLFVLGQLGGMLLLTLSLSALLPRDLIRSSVRL